MHVCRSPQIKMLLQAERNDVDSKLLHQSIKKINKQTNTTQCLTISVLNNLPLNQHRHIGRKGGESWITVLYAATQGRTGGRVGGRYIHTYVEWDKLNTLGVYLVGISIQKQKNLHIIFCPAKHSGKRIQHHL